MRKLSSTRPSIAITKVLVASILTAYSLSVSAGTATSNLSVTTSVAANCTITTSAVGFGAYDPVVTNNASALQGTGTVTVTCTSGSAGTITLGQGISANTGSSDTAPLRRMLSGTTNYLSYSLYSDTGRTTVWGNTAGTGVVRTGTGAADAVTVYGSVAPGQNVPAGSYTDTVVATVTF
jgi:spore coat protein U-like protein